MNRSAQVAGSVRVPSRVKAIGFNVTATDVTSPQGTFLTVFPGGAVSSASSLKAATSWTIANAVTSRLSVDGKVSICNEKPTADVIVDVNDYFG